MDKVEFDAVIKEADGGGAFVEFPFNVQQLYGTKGQVKIKATFDGCPYRGSMANMGSGCHLIIVLKNIRKEINKNVGDSIHVTVEQDREPRIVNLPEDFLTALEEVPKALSYFEKLSYTHKKEYVQWIVSAKRTETRTNRMKKAVEMLANEQFI